MREILKRGRTTALVAALSLTWIAPLQAFAQLLPPLPLPGGSLVVAITSPASGAIVNDTTTVSASVSIIGALTVSSVQFRLDGANLGARDTSAPYSVSWNTTATPDGSHALTAVARDAAGISNTSAPVTVAVANSTPPPPPPPPPPAGSATRFEENDPSITYSAGWTPDGNDGHLSWSGGTAVVSAAPGAQATFTFTGTSVSWIGGRSPDTGIARISLDGAFLTEVDTYSKTLEARVPMFAATGLANARHTLTIEVAGRQKASATSDPIFVDAFDVPALTVSRLEGKDPSLIYSGTALA